MEIHVDMVVKLLDLGIDPKMIDAKNRSPLKIAQEQLMCITKSDKCTCRLSAIANILSVQKAMGETLK